MRILLLSAYDTHSHRYWRESLVRQFPEHDWTTLALPPRHFNFRVRGNPLSWLGSYAGILSADYQLLVATSLVDVATLRGLVPSLARTPLWLYCHENQFAYPASGEQQKRAALQHDLDVKMVFIYNWLCADWTSFNSQWNRNSALEGIEQLFSAFPERLPAGLLQQLRERSGVLPVPLEPLPRGQALNRQSTSVAPVEIVWNHRWEYDKGPAYLLAFARHLRDAQVPVRLHVVGPQFRCQPREFAALQQLLAEAGTPFAGRLGYVEYVADYYRLLDNCDLVLSTALHDFQGLAVLEAVQRGCMPLLPDRLAYPEQFDARWLYAWHDDLERCAQSMLSRLQALLAGRPPAPTLQAFEWPALRGRYIDVLERLTSSQ